jgi:Holliday junction resolvasome RuvABC endonuclease subunit
MGGFTTLSIDLGSTIGYAIGRDGVIVESGEVTLSAGHGKTHPGHRWLRFQNWLAKYGAVNEILYEDVPRFESASAAKVYGALLGVLQIFSLAHGIRMCSLKPNQVKKDFTGYGNANKLDMCEVAIKLGWKRGIAGTMNNNNECDALALFWVVCVRRGIEPQFLVEAL